MSIFITGACGFVGLALTEALLAQGRDVVGYDLSTPPEAALRTFSALPGTFRCVRGDVTDEPALRAAMSQHAARRVVALAAITADAARERTAPGRILAVNTGGAIATVAASAACGVERIVYTSSGSVYGASGEQAQRLDEGDTPLRPEGLYGISKQAAEASVRRLAQLHGLDLVIGRLGTCFGRWEMDTGLRDTLSAPLQVVRHALRGTVAVLPRPGRRDWLYSRDAAAALIALLDAKDDGADPHRIYNLSAGFEWTIERWCAALEARWPDFRWHLAGAGETPTVDYYAPYDRASMDNRRLLSATGFTPCYDIDAAVADFCSWLGTHRALALDAPRSAVGTA